MKILYRGIIIFFSGVLVGVSITGIIINTDRTSNFIMLAFGFVFLMVGYIADEKELSRK